MNIDKVIELWQKSKYKYLLIRSMPVVRDDKEVVKPSALLNRNDKYCFGKEMSVFDYILATHNKNSLYYLEEIKDNEMLIFNEIIKGE